MRLKGYGRNTAESHSNRAIFQFCVIWKLPCKNFPMQKQPFTCYIKILFLKISRNSQENTESLFNKVSDLQPATLLTLFTMGFFGLCSNRRGGGKLLKLFYETFPTEACILFLHCLPVFVFGLCHVMSLWHHFYDHPLQIM